jgi:transposase InsO family protein
MAESFVDTFKTELLADRVWRARAQLELAVVEYIGWSNTARLHSAIDYLTRSNTKPNGRRPGSNAAGSGRPHSS